jgi:aspartate aminotransferase
VLEENARRSANDGPLYVMYDQVYWMLTAGDKEHVDPIGLRPEMRQYTVLVDAISKAFAATGLRVGWAIGPADVIRAMADVNTHVGAWAPRPEQYATAKMLCDTSAVDQYIDQMRRDAADRLRALADGLRSMKAAGLPVDCIEPEGAIYVSARFNLRGRRAPNGNPLDTNDQVRRYLLDAAGLGAVPFQAFGFPGDSGWFRLSIGVVSVADIDALMPRIREAIERTTGPHA